MTQPADSFTSVTDALFVATNPARFSDTPAAARRQRRAAALGADILSLFSTGLTATNLRHRALSGQPYDLIVDMTDRGAERFSLRLYGLQTPPCRSETAAMIAWARMATSQPAPSEVAA